MTGYRLEVEPAWADEIPCGLWRDAGEVARAVADLELLRPREVRLCNAAGELLGRLVLERQEEAASRAAEGRQTDRRRPSRGD